MTLADKLKKYRMMIDKSLEEYLSKEIGAIDDPFIRYGYTLIEEFALGGKRLRPIAFFLAYEANGGKDRDKVMPIALAIELHHTYSLILDDVMDEDSLRRGKPAVHASLLSHFLKNYPEQISPLFGTSGKRFAVSNAIMLANITNILSKKLILGSEVGPKAEIIRIIEEADQSIYHGQMMDIMSEYEDIDESRYLRIIEGKSAILFGISLQLGSLLSAPGMQEVMKSFGIEAAMAFQMKDDLLDISPGKGHDMGSDIRKGKRTLLMIKTLELAGSRKAEILSVRGNQRASPKDISKAITIIEECGAVAYCREKAAERISSAKKMIASLPGSQILGEFAEYLVSREF